MFGKLKSAVGEGAIRTAIEKYSPQINAKLAQITALRPADVTDDAAFHRCVIAPALAAVTASAGSATRMISNFDERFAIAMLHVRDQLIVVDQANDKVSLVPDYQARSATVLTQGFAKGKAAG